MSKLTDDIWIGKKRYHRRLDSTLADFLEDESANGVEVPDLETFKNRVLEKCPELDWESIQLNVDDEDDLETLILSCAVKHF